MHHHTRAPRRSIVVVLPVVLALASLVPLAHGATAAPGQAASPQITVTPSTGLSDGQNITINGSGFTPSQAIGVSMCKLPFQSGNDCDFSTAKIANGDANGAFTMQYQVKATLFSGAHACAPSSCALGASNLNTDGEFANPVTLTFGAQVTTTTAPAATTTRANQATTTTRAGATTTTGAGGATTTTLSSTATTLANTGASDSLSWIAGTGAALLAGGGILALRRRRSSS